MCVHGIYTCVSVNWPAAGVSGVLTDVWGGVQEKILNTPQNISIKSISYADECGTTFFEYKLPVLKYERSPV